MSLTAPDRYEQAEPGELIMTCRCSHLLFREWTERRPTGLVLRSRVALGYYEQAGNGKGKVGC